MSTDRNGSTTGFPTVRMRRLRATEAMRSLVRETQVTRNDLVYPMFVVEGKRVRREIGSMPGNYQLSVDELVAEAARAYLAGVPAVILFGIPAQKDPLGSGAYQDNGIIPRAVAALKDAMPQLIVMTDICLCEYTSHGHCGVVSEDRILNDPSLELLAHSAVAHARAGADVVAPSDMMDGRVKAIRSALDGEGYEDVPVLAYSAKFASGFYGPFREAAESTPQFGDRRSYQMDPANRREALREVLLDVQEGADMVMVKPGLPYLDLVREVRDLVDMPVAVYNVSGEFAMVKAAAANGWIDERRVVLEILTGFKRAGASFILTYHAPDAARWLAEDASHKVKVKKTVGRR